MCPPLSLNTELNFKFRLFNCHTGNKLILQVLLKWRFCVWTFHQSWKVFSLCFFFVRRSPDSLWFTSRLHIMWASLFVTHKKKTTLFSIKVTRTIKKPFPSTHTFGKYNTEKCDSLLPKKRTKRHIRSLICFWIDLYWKLTTWRYKKNV